MVIFSKDFLDNIEKDSPRGCWSTQIDAKGTTVTLRSLLWPGYYSFHRLESAIFGSVYLGDGVKNIDLPFMIWLMNSIARHSSINCNKSLWTAASSVVWAISLLNKQHSATHHQLLMSWKTLRSTLVTKKSLTRVKISQHTLHSFSNKMVRKGAQPVSQKQNGIHSRLMHIYVWVSRKKMNPLCSCMTNFKE